MIVSTLSALLGLAAVVILRAPAARRLDRWAAHRMMDRFFDDLSDGWSAPRVKTDDDLAIEAWLWKQLGEFQMVATLLDARTEVDR